MAPSPVPSRGPKRGRNCYITPAFSGVPCAKRADKLRIGHLTRGFLGGPKEGGIATYPLHSRGSPTPRARTKLERATSPVPSQRPKRGRNCYVTLAFSGVPNAKCFPITSKQSPVCSLSEGVVWVRCIATSNPRCCLPVTMCSLCLHQWRVPQFALKYPCNPPPPPGDRRANEGDCKGGARDTKMVPKKRHLAGQLAGTDFFQYAHGATHKKVSIFTSGKFGCIPLVQ